MSTTKEDLIAMLDDARGAYHDAALAGKHDYEQRLIDADKKFFAVREKIGATLDARVHSSDKETPRAEQHENTRSTIAVTTRGTVLVIERDETGAPVSETELGADVAAARGRALLSASRIAIGVLRENASEDEEE